MSKLYIILFFLGVLFHVEAQSLLPKYIKYAEEQMQKGDYYNAVIHLEKALEIDSNTVDILWKMAEAQNAYKNYEKATYYYSKVYQKENSQMFPSCLLKLGLMQKQNGEYDRALASFKKAKKLYSKDKRNYLYIKSKQEVESTIWAISQLPIYEKLDMQRLPEPVNSPNAEFGHTIVNNTLYFSSLRGDSVSNQEEVYSKKYLHQIYKTEIENMKTITPLFATDHHQGNGTFSTDGKRFYYSKCQDNNGAFTCKIAVRIFENGTFKNEDILGEIINSSEATTTTMPHIAHIDEKEYLFFCSNRKDSEGGLDIYFSEVKNGHTYTKAKAIKSINSIEDEITPFWDVKQQRLYFSSTWNQNFGGMDVFYSSYANGTFGTPQNAGQPTNSPANDNYFFIAQEEKYVSSNRVGVLYAKNPTCCSDIFKLQKPSFFAPPTPSESLAELNKRLPVTLFFHNDEPNPRTTASSTTQNYLTTYTKYLELEETYKKEYQYGLKGDDAQFAAEDIEDFFLEYVKKGVNDLSLFTQLLFEELQTGKHLHLIVRGFASPLAKTEYNVQLTKRRISSLENYLHEWQNGALVKYFESGKLAIEQVPFGEYNANQLISDNPNDQKQSVYSRAAALERKIEINSISTEDTGKVSNITLKNAVFDAGKKPLGSNISATFEIQNSGEEVVLELAHKDACIDAPAALLLERNKETKLTVFYHTEGYFGHSTRQIVYIHPQTKERYTLNVTTVLQ